MDGILDSSLIIELFKGNAKILNALPRDLNYFIATITVFELYCGKLKEREEIMIEKLPKVEFCENSAKIAGKIYRDLKEKGKIPSVKDLLLASTAIAKDKIILTCDEDFEIFRDYGLKLKILER
ncbi:MAG: type II toxin-antitoxin system VapC family toxin [Archaeoglobales archaeon]|nr:type II toxin-antitoxin system VapC family toxin [Archaeoglobales archaeon]